jgi:hypothetical protein
MIAERDWPMARTVERQASRMAEMMDKLGVDPMKLVRLRGGEAFAEARTNCLKCSHVHECLSWLDANSVERPRFCVDLPLFESCRKDRWSD